MVGNEQLTEGFRALSTERWPCGASHRYGEEKRGGAPPAEGAPACGAGDHCQLHSPAES